VNAIRAGLAGLLVACFLSGCCVCDCDHSPIAYSDGNPYECWKCGECGCDFWGVGYYCEKYGFLRSTDPCAPSAR
jgi:hypothetical protein